MVTVVVVAQLVVMAFRCSVVVVTVRRGLTHGGICIRI